MPKRNERMMPATGREMPEHVAVIHALAALRYEFELPNEADEHPRVVGYAPGSVVEVVEGPQATVSLLFSISTRLTLLRATRMAVIAVASATRVDFLEWLADQMRSRGSSSPWKATRIFERRRVHAELLSEDAMLLTIEAIRQRPARARI